ncbi:hypothetical protein llap_18092 [Limosa lapponica baueri]|uniref:Uncharacterized protein n=1 Tax=Limosa lapponica baueri TaxID=1758121 RepID=A0A2I0TCQ6_LIMLA|nr:hypothetical protein llap_18092 [Limosa lapponica baueri]
MMKIDLWSHEKKVICLGFQESSENSGGTSSQENSLSVDLHYICNSTLSISSEPPDCEWRSEMDSDARPIISPEKNATG